MIREESFMLVNLGPTRMGVLKTIGKRGMVVSCEFIDGATEGDNAWLMEQAKLLYEQYYARVNDYRRGC